jgi:ubiquinone/menaquinone biosynthesis C-methylase UbiE
LYSNKEEEAVENIFKERGKQEFENSHFMDEVAKHLMPSTYSIYATLDWEQAARELRNPVLKYPAYYTVPHHGMAEGYLSHRQASAWEFIEYLFRMHRVRPALLQMAACPAPRTVVDFGCGTATTSIQLAQMLPETTLTLVDLSPYELAAARCQAEHAGLAQRTRYLHAQAEATGLANESIDIVFASLLFHELPCSVAQNVVREAWRLLHYEGRLIIFDPIQCVVPWKWLDCCINTILAHFIHEVYWMEYMRQPLWNVCRNVGFQQVERKLLIAFPWVYQVIIATK